MRDKERGKRALLSRLLCFSGIPLRNTLPSLDPTVRMSDCRSVWHEREVFCFLFLVFVFFFGPVVLILCVLENAHLYQNGGERGTSAAQNVIFQPKPTPKINWKIFGLRVLRKDACKGGHWTSLFGEMFSNCKGWEEEMGIISSGDTFFRRKSSCRVEVLVVSTATKIGTLPTVRRRQLLDTETVHTEGAAMLLYIFVFQRFRDCMYADVA